MCEGCVKSEFPNRGRMCLDSGTYMMNLKMCSQCSSNNLATTNKSASEERNIETVTYNHICNDCQHVIAVHNFSFWIDGGYQEYEMECLLCGSAEDSVSIMPVDPRKVLGFDE